MKQINSKHTLEGPISHGRVSWRRNEGGKTDKHITCTVPLHTSFFIIGRKSGVMGNLAEMEGLVYVSGHWLCWGQEAVWGDVERGVASLAIGPQVCGVSEEEEANQ
jgi:hypothetical protein